MTSSLDERELITTGQAAPTALATASEPAKGGARRSLFKQRKTIHKFIFNFVEIKARRTAAFKCFVIEQRTRNFRRNRGLIHSSFLEPTYPGVLVYARLTIAGFFCS
ncbi:hypothetical protein OG777_30740 [Micromonospora peucetia]|uniref:hypothetical protein n=1 Tax=Micromonospora peucetia TaxID=47871 RepID=UPI00224D2507|nr:hypothetical protein [Micromonospora peucetia]MCX4391283.1 hypothetical protein [Micromonospora peucetia]